MYGYTSTLNLSRTAACTPCDTWCRAPGRTWSRWSPRTPRWSPHADLLVLGVALLSPLLCNQCNKMWHIPDYTKLLEKQPIVVTELFDELESILSLSEINICIVLGINAL